MTDRLLRLPEVRALIGVGKTTIYTWAAAGAFPKPLKLSERAVAWRESEIKAWIEARASAAA